VRRLVRRPATPTTPGPGPPHSGISRVRGWERLPDHAGTSSTLRPTRETRHVFHAGGHWNRRRGSGHTLSKPQVTARLCRVLCLLACGHRTASSTSGVENNRLYAFREKDRYRLPQRQLQRQHRQPGSWNGTVILAKDNLHVHPLKQRLRHPTRSTAPPTSVLSRLRRRPAVSPSMLPMPGMQTMGSFMARRYCRQSQTRTGHRRTHGLGVSSSTVRWHLQGSGKHPSQTATGSPSTTAPRIRTRMRRSLIRRVCRHHRRQRP